MDNVVEMVDLLEDKLTRLILNQEQLKEENRRLKQSELLLLDKVSQQNLFMKDLEDKYQSLKVANAIVGNKEDKHLTKIKINTLIREIDKCIVQLSE
ncbi:MAG TPA: hypothetical protein EYG80_01295 [Flavobacteriaceae bacterium]|nr:hypothetical protein [Flavobacteriaceae bacterium]